MAVIDSKLTEQASSKEAGIIASLRKENARLKQKNNNLENSRRPSTNVYYNDKGLVVDTFISERGKRFTNTRTHEISSVYTAVLPLIQPLIQLVKAGSIGREIDHREYEREKDSENKLTRERVRDEDGNFVYRPNHLDRARSAAYILLQDETARSALERISEILNDRADDINNIAYQLANGQGVEEFQNLDNELRDFVKNKVRKLK